ncbi:MAG: hypothetical protein QW117_03185 [Candidatus Pacearchaeota archaeon]
MTKFDFSYPEGFFGFHSGWNNNDEFTKRLSLTFRKPIRLKIYPSEILEEYNPKLKNIPFLIKDSKGEYLGLSCGTGGALVKIEGETYKFKRNGTKYKGFIKNCIIDREILFKKKIIIESNIYEHRGTLDYNDAKREIKNYHLIIKEGFVSPYIPIGIRRVLLPFRTSETYCSLIYLVNSDLRVDEFCMAVIINILAKLKDSVQFNKKKNYFLIKNIKVTRILKDHHEKLKLLYNLGKKIGFIYRKLHNKGFIRGIGNSWYGNEIIMPNGEIGITDLDSMYSKDSFKGNEESFLRFQKNDLNLFITGVYSSLAYFENCIFDFSAQSLIEGFNIGYLKYKDVKLNKHQILSEIEEFQKNKEIMKNAFK